MDLSSQPAGRGRVGRAVVAALLAIAVVPFASHVASAAPERPSKAVAGTCAAGFPAYHRAAVAGSSQLLSNLAVPMSDGVILRADVTLPVGPKGPFPTALTITGYSKSSPITGLGGGGAGSLVGHGYATVTIDDRGTGSSGGTWDSWGPRTIADYGEILDWIVKQPWSDGRIGITGTSYMGITSLLAASTGRPSVKAVFATVPMADAYRDIVEAGGELNTAFIPLWMGLVTGLGLTPNGFGSAPQVLADHLLGTTQFQLPTVLAVATGGSEAYDGPFWRQRSPIEVASKITAPTFIVGGLDDLFQRGEPLLYEHLADHTDARLLIGPWTHTAAGTGLPHDGVPDTGSLLLQWFDQHVLGLPAHAECIPQVTQFVRGHDRYESSTSWPVPGLTAQRWDLRGTGGLTTTPPAAGEASRSYVELPVTGPCSRSTAQWLIGVIDGTSCARDNRIEELADLTYTSSPFTQGSVINGPIEADLWVTTDSPDAVVSVAISDVAPDGTSRGLTNGLLLATNRAVDRSRSRLLDGQSIQPWHPFTATARQAVTPGQPMLLPIEVFPTSAAIAPGHRLRVSVAPYDVPHALPPLPGLLDTIAGTVHVLSDAAHPSSVVLPVEPTGGRPAAVQPGPVATPATRGAAAPAAAPSPAGGRATPVAAAVDGRPIAARSTAARDAAIWVLLPVIVIGTLVRRRRRRTPA